MTTDLTLPGQADNDAGPRRDIFTSKLVFGACMVVLILLLLLRTLDVAFPNLIRVHTIVRTDFDAFHVAGRLFWSGRVTAAYDGQTITEVIHRMDGQRGVFLWTYPPPFLFVAAALGVLPLWLSYFAFAGSTSIAYLMLLRRFAGQWLPGVVASAYPVIVLNMVIGQNGCLTGALLGAFALWQFNRRGFAGIPLGLMVIKPHLALGAGLVTLLQRQWAVVGAALVVIAGLCAAATVAFTIAVWPAFIASLQQSGALLDSGDYPLRLMTSAYALMRALGASAPVAMIGQAVSVIAALVLTVVASRRYKAAGQLLGIGLCCTPFMSPYFYYYDLPVFYLGVAILAPTTLSIMRPIERVLMITINWIGIILPIVWATLQSPPPRGVSLGTGLAAGHTILPASGVAAFAILCMLVTMLERSRSHPSSPAVQLGPA